jgi:hypothetical protein
MTAPANQGSAPPGAEGPGAAAYPTGWVADFLETRNVSVLDVTRGIAADTRRLMVGDPESGTVTYVVAVAPRLAVRTGSRAAAETGTSVDVEHDVLEAMTDVLRPSLRATLPQVVERVEVAPTLTGLVVTGVPGLRSSVESERLRPLFDAAEAWLAAVWQDTAGEAAQSDLGAVATSTVMARFAGSRRLAPALKTLHRARLRLGQHEIRRSLSHGCLCPRHVMVDGATVTGVDDWGVASAAGDPLRDLGGWAARISEGRLDEVVTGRTVYAVAVRRFVTAGLERAAVPKELWREVLVLSQLELALEALDRGDSDGITELILAVRALPKER